jgi:hypothetical protein
MTTHPTDDLLELYVLHRLQQPEVETVEEHLMICHPCRERSEDVAIFALAIKDALRTSPVEVEARWLGWLRPNFALAGAFAALVVTAGIYWTNTTTRLAPVATLQLTAMRGTEVASAVPAREFDFKLADSGSASQVKIVSADGRKVFWTGPNAPTVVVHKSLATGDYLLRAYLPTGVLLHEYAFRIQK